MNYCENEEHKERAAKAKAEMPSDEQLTQMGARFKVISESSRLKILLALSGGELCVEHITAVVDAAQSAVSHQLKTLKDNKIVKSRRSGKNVLYSVSDWHVLTMIGVAKEHLDCDE